MSTHNRNRKWHARQPVIERDPLAVEANIGIREWVRNNRWWIAGALGDKKFQRHYQELVSRPPMDALVELRLYEQEVAEAIEMASVYVEVN